MARFDIMPLRGALGGAHTIEYASITTLAVPFDVGEPVNVVAAGTLTASPQDTTEWIQAEATTGHLMGICAFGPGAASSAARPSDRINTNPATGLPYAVGDVVGFWPIDRGIQFVARLGDDLGANFVVPAEVDLGESFQVVYGTAGTPDNGWMVNQTAGVTAVDVCAQVVDILDTNKNSINSRLFGTGRWVVVLLRSQI